MRALMLISTDWIEPTHEYTRISDKIPPAALVKPFFQLASKRSFCFFTKFTNSTLLHLNLLLPVIPQFIPNTHDLTNPIISARTSILYPSSDYGILHALLERKSSSYQAGEDLRIYIIYLLK
ncbi:70be6527-18a9-47d7-9032-ad17c74ac1f2 [Sclerotinia trifoliorum]|uniref:70be6527-18a9-47d7-9032-ad17c74ac1f2 n=1 Tax=Sclerotinia trifoliorum TaxID=28548 RepID=A0A8H2ZUA1_9HELO|nr:70be6527-18a9-47d7-9032-ad17c74ac1f2 [Sclerotinia trifoliorum]